MFVTKLVSTCRDNIETERYIGNRRDVITTNVKNTVDKPYPNINRKKIGMCI